MRYTTKKEFDKAIQLLTDKIKELEVKSAIKEKSVIKSNIEVKK